jgi:hypothetical protein
MAPLPSQVSSRAMGAFQTNVGFSIFLNGGKKNRE